MLLWTMDINGLEFREEEGTQCRYNLEKNENHQLAYLNSQIIPPLQVSLFLRHYHVSCFAELYALH